jgi:hypothetical protein
MDIQRGAFGESSNLMCTSHIFLVSYCIVKPPSTTRQAPVMKLLIGDARKTMESAISSIFANLPIGVRSSSLCIVSVPVADSKSGVDT